MSEAEPRRSVRSTKGQHKGLPDSLEQPAEPKRRGKKAASKKQAEPEPEDEEEEVIRCVCGATSQDTDDPDDPWIACDQCHVWQHNVCVGMSVFDEDLEDIEYYCEECKPQNHKALLEGLKKGEHIWETRRKEYMEEKEAEKKQKKGPKKGRKRQSELHDEPRSAQKSTKSSASPAPEKKLPATKAAAAKRKERHDSADTAAKEPSKLRKVSESQAVAAPPYEPPSDLPDTIAGLAEGRQGPAKLLQKSLLHALNQHEKKGGYNPSDGVSNDSRSERLAIAIERAVHDSHPARDEYGRQCRTLGANLKSNQELIGQLLNHSLTPPMLAVMTSDDLQTEKQQQETAAAKERNVRQSIIATDEVQPGPRYKRTHKGDELIDDGYVGADSPGLPARQPPQAAKASGSRAQQSHSRKPSGEPMKIDTQQQQQQSPTSNFDINKVFSSVKSPTATTMRRPSGPAPSQGPGVDPDVDRLLEDDGNESPPYSPTEETDPDVVWRGQLIMAATADFQAVAKHVAGANLFKTINLPWTTLLPRKLNVGGRIATNSATEYLCSLRWNSMVDLVVTSLTPATEAGKADFDKIFNYFVSKERWAVVGDKGTGNVKDTYLIPVPAGTGNHPEFLLNLEENYLPNSRTENMLLLVIVFRNDENTLKKLHGPDWNTNTNSSGPSPVPNNASPSPAPSTFPQRGTPMAGPAFSPTTPQVGAGVSPVPYSGVQGQHHIMHSNVQAGVAPAPAQFATGHQDAEAQAKAILGPFATAPTLGFLMPHAHKMAPNEWSIIRRVLEREPKAREDLAVLGSLIAKEQTPISLPTIPGMPASVHQSYQQAQAQARNAQSPPAAPPA
ncbi:hypothetical protein M406DRAFT_348063 [Cryphonectria parasitica EP155]|uniref:Transcription factor BYE1 n=1 Tax=Cryphonectria parasitica (strain ATCC 38755 / EP155) TaxID=660469 RepID=A0A9P5CLK8_CRYP1|nr:uncharacterized protein M406DRAFT_348063 [Cryphonectria parasitica EP155]KAF3761930.1 hypothetical protein M406DRAFT_348063 [Cryphonectria parasitica EP155]